MLGRAFRDNPAYLAIFAHRSDAERAGAVARVKHGFTASAVRFHETDALWVGDRLAAAALILPPGHWPLGPRAWLGRAMGCLTTGPRAIWNFLRVDHRVHAWHLREPHFYLFVLGVEPDLQGRGFGKTLLARLNARAEQARVPCFLETDRQSSVRLYESVGYRVVTDEVLANVNGLRIWTMTRPAIA